MSQGRTFRGVLSGFAVLAFFLGAALSAHALGPHGDVFAGYSTFGLSGHNGAEAELHVKVTHFLGVEGDVSGYENGNDPAADRVYLYLVGPRLTASAFHIKIYVHGMGGRIEPSGGTATSGAFLYGLGGGVDLPLISRLNWRVAFDYVHAPNGIATGKRLSTGPVFRF